MNIDPVGFFVWIAVGALLVIALKIWQKHI